MKTYMAIVTETQTTRVRFRAERATAALKELKRIERHARRRIGAPKEWKRLKPTREVSVDLGPLPE